MLSPLDPTPDAWDTFVRAHPRAHFLQLWHWGDLKAAFGWQVERFAIAEDGRLAAVAQVLLRPFPYNVGRMGYLAMGPLAATDSQRAYLWKLIHRRLNREKRATFLKWEPGIYAEGDPPPDFARLGFRASDETVQPPRTILLDLHPGEDAILARMNQGTRRKIRQSLKKDVVYYEATRDDLVKFDSIMQTTGERKEFGVHNADYYAMMYDGFVPHGDAALILAEHEGDTLAAVFVFAVGKTAWYLSGASSDVKRNLMASYGVQWRAVQWAKERGCRVYDMWGVPDEHPVILEERFQERNEGLWGVYGFKRGWGGEVVRSLGAWDRVYNGLMYNAYKVARSLRGE